MDQISKPRASVAPVPQPVASSSRATPGTEPEAGGAQGQRRSNAPPAQLVELCRNAGLSGGATPDGLNCARVLEEAEGRAAQPNGEGVLLEMLGQSSSVTGPAPVEQQSVDADAVARQLSTGAVPGGSGSDAAGAIVRRDAPPPNQPR